MPSKQNILPIVGVLSSALVWGLIWYPYRVLQDAGVSGGLATLCTYSVAVLCGVFVLPRVWREWPTAGWWSALLVLSAGWANFGYVLAMLRGDVMRVLLLFYLAPVWTILFSRWLLGERPNRYGYLVIALSFCGAFIMLWEPNSGMPLPQNMSEWIGVSAGMGFALSNVVSRRASTLSVMTKSCSVLIGTAALTAPLLWWQGGVPQQFLAFDGQIVLLLVLMGGVLFATSMAVQYGVTHLPANRAMLLFLFELVVAAVAAYLLADEVMQWRDWLGAVLIVSASLLSGKLHHVGDHDHDHDHGNGNAHA